MSGSVEVRAPTIDYGSSQWVRARIFIVLATVLILWTTLALVIGYTHVAIGNMFSVSKRHPHWPRRLMRYHAPKGQ